MSDQLDRLIPQLQREWRNSPISMKLRKMFPKATARRWADLERVAILKRLKDLGIPKEVRDEADRKLSAQVGESKS